MHADPDPRTRIAKKRTEQEYARLKEDILALENWKDLDFNQIARLVGWRRDLVYRVLKDLD